MMATIRTIVRCLLRFLGIGTSSKVPQKEGGMLPASATPLGQSEHSEYSTQAQPMQRMDAAVMHEAAIMPEDAQAPMMQAPPAEKPVEDDFPWQDDGYYAPERQGAQAHIYTNRELSWLAFNRRVLSEATNADNPLMERVKFLSISASNLDEFFMVRFASWRYRMLKGRENKDPSGMTPREQVMAIAEDAGIFAREQGEIYAQLHAQLAMEGLRISALSSLSGDQLAWVEETFQRDILPCVAPHVYTKGQPFPQVAGRALQMGFFLRHKRTKKQTFASMQKPAGMPRLWRMPGALGGDFVYFGEIIKLYAARLVPEYTVLGVWPYRVTRDEDYVVAEDVTENLVAETRKELLKRKTGAIVRLEVEEGASAEFVSLLRKVLHIRTDAIYRIRGPLGLSFLIKDLARHGDAGMVYPPFEGRMPAAFLQHADTFSALRAGDVFLHHPYESFDAVLRFVQESAADPRVLAINMTLYRVSGNSPVIQALCDAAEAGKRVTVLLELKARFDEANNIRWAEMLARAGCEVIYGMPRLKTHSKITLVVRREENGLMRYVHLGTGNYNDVTARLYTDMGVMTCDEAFGEDAQSFFNMITGFSKEPHMQRLIYAPRMLRQSLTTLIEAETANARAGKPSGIFAKMNSLVDPGIIRLLYEASAAGVPIRLIIRGTCCLRAGVPGLSETIQVRSIVGRFLEHSRVFRFENGGDTRIFLSSADWMPRNLNKRIELMFPVVDVDVQKSVSHVLDMQWQDNAKAWQMLPDGRYERMPVGPMKINAQEMLFESDSLSTF